MILTDHNKTAKNGVQGVSVDARNEQRTAKVSVIPRSNPREFEFIT